MRGTREGTILERVNNGGIDRHTEKEGVTESEREREREREGERERERERERVTERD